MKNVYLFQPQYAVEFRKEKNYWLPYSAACVWTYAAQFKDITDNFKLSRIFFKREPIDTVLDQIEDPTLCGFSCYMWNEQYCLAMAQAIKARWPDCVIAFGGAQTSASMLKHKFIDSIMIAEGEESFLKLLRTVQSEQAPDTIYPQQRLEHLDIPSPYTTGIFDSIIEENPGVVWAMSLETNRGCPYACTFCDWGGVTYSKVKKFSLERLAGDLEWIKKHNVAYVFVTDANFGIFKERDLEVARLIRAAADESRIESINLQYAKNSTDIVFEIAKIIGPYGRGVTVSVQSMNDLTLETIKRKNMDVNNIGRLMQLSQQHGIGTYTEVILGLPDETKQTWISGLNQLLELGQHQSIDIWFAQLLENSELASNTSRLKYGIQSINVKDYMNLDQSSDNVPEYTEIVNATASMSTEDMIECYMYTWMIIQFHIAGYTQIVAKYARNCAGISYETFYNALYQAIYNDTTFQDHCIWLRGIVENYLKNGQLPNNFVGGHALHSASYKFLFDNKQKAAELAEQVLTTLTNIPKELTELQYSFIIDFNKQYPYNIDAGFNIDSGEIKATQYTIESRLKEPTEDFYTLRRNGLIKNLLKTS
jgi:hypothetical protein